MSKSRRVQLSILLVAITVLLFTAPIQASEITLQGEIVQGRFLVPMRGIFEALGAVVDWDGDTRTVTGTKGNICVKLTIDSNTATVNGETLELDVSATIIDGRTFVPTRFVSESLGAHVVWDGEKRVATIAQEGIVIKVHEIQDPEINDTEDIVQEVPHKPSTEAEFVIVRDSRLVFDPISFGMKNESDWYRAVVTEDKGVMILEGPGKVTEDGKSLVMQNNTGEDGFLASRTFFILDLGFTFKSVSGYLVGEKNEALYLPEAGKTVNIIYSGEKVRMTGNETGDHFILKGLKRFAVSSIEKMD